MEAAHNKSLERTRLNKVERLLPTLASHAPVRSRPEGLRLAAQLER
jgi:hypothetical protein